MHLFFHRSEVASGCYHFHHYLLLHYSPVSSGQNRLSGRTSLAAEPLLARTNDEGERELADVSQGRCLFGEFPMPVQVLFWRPVPQCSSRPLSFFSIQVEDTEQKGREEEKKEVKGTPTACC
jgi:hypothetical protein